MGVIIQGNSSGISNNQNDPQVWGHVSVQGPCCHYSHADLSGLHCHMG